MCASTHPTISLEVRCFYTIQIASQPFILFTLPNPFHMLSTSHAACSRRGLYRLDDRRFRRSAATPVISTAYILQSVSLTKKKMISVKLDRLRHLRLPAKLVAVSWRDLLMIVAPVLLVTALAAWLAVKFFHPAPPSSIVMLAGPKESSYYTIAERYAKIIARSGVKIQFCLMFLHGIAAQPAAGL